MIMALSKRVSKLERVMMPDLVACPECGRLPGGVPPADVKYEVTLGDRDREEGRCGYLDE